jgi:hypothetical protein
MVEPIIGGAISASIGAAVYAGIALWQERRREKLRELHVVEDLIAELEDNLKIATSPAARAMWWMVPYKIDAYQSNKGSFSFLPLSLRATLRDLNLLLEGVNTGIRVHQLATAYGRPTIEHPIETPPDVVKTIAYCIAELRKWRESNSLKVRRRSK